jgi:hypothetical protein
MDQEWFNGLEEKPFTASSGLMEIQYTEVYGARGKR